MLEQSLHLFEEAAVHENCANAAQELVEVDILLLTFIEKCEDAFEDLRRVLETEHLSNFDKIEALDAGRTMVLLEKRVRMEDIVLEALHVHSVQCDQAVSAKNVHIRGNYSISTWYVCSEASKVGRCLLQITEMLREELNWVLWSVLKKK